MSFAQQLRWHVILSTNLIVMLLLLGSLLVTLPALMVRHVKVLQREEREHERSAFLATHDLLTGLPNRFLFTDRFEQAVLQHTRNGNSFALMLIDLDHFKEINDQHSHEIGDQALIAAAQRMSGEIRACDSVARHGGDEFVVLLTNILSLEDAEVVGHKLCQAIAKPIRTSVGDLNITCSIGIAVYPKHGQSLETLRKSADHAMYQAKTLGRNAVATAGG